MGTCGIYDVLCKSALGPLVDYHLAAPTILMIILRSVESLKSF